MEKFIEFEFSIYGWEILVHSSIRNFNDHMDMGGEGKRIGRRNENE